MKFVTELKEGYLYRAKDDVTDEIILVSYVNLENDVIRAETIMFMDTESVTFDGSWGISFGRISDVIETSKDFDDNNFAFYEIGKKEDYPEYYLWK